MNKKFRQRICGVCGSLFTPTSGIQKFCPGACAKLHERRKKREQAKRLRENNQALFDAVAKKMSAAKAKSRLNALGFVMRSYFVHPDDGDVVLCFINALREKKIKELVTARMNEKSNTEDES